MKSLETATHNGIGDLDVRFLYVGRHRVAWDTYFGLDLGMIASSGPTVIV